MKELVEEVFIGKWKSFKVFKHSGKVHLHTIKEYCEFNFDCDKLLTIRNIEKGSSAILATTDKWAISLKDRRHYLDIPLPKLRYEVITINHTTMVIDDMVSGEKTFFTKEDLWQSRLDSNREIII